MDVLYDGSGLCSRCNMEEMMDILISIQEEDFLLISERIKTYFSQEFPNAEFEWKHQGTTLAASLPVSENEIVRVFEDLVKKYPRLDVKASCSCDIREDDRSAQWWRVTEIYSEEEDGQKKIVSSSSTYWN